MLKARSNYYFEANGCGSPITLLQGPKTIEAVEKATQLTAYYSDQKMGIVQVKFGKEKLEKQIFVNMLQRKRWKNENNVRKYFAVNSVLPYAVAFILPFG